MVKNEYRHEKMYPSNRNIRYTQYFFSSLALACVGFFAVWWFNPAHLPNNFATIPTFWDVLFFMLVSYVIWHPIIMEVLTWVISSHIKDIREQKPVQGLKVAFITTIVPGMESLELLHKCLPAMVNVLYPHDTWLLDEGNNPEVKAICEQYGVMHFSRRGKEEFNTPQGKFTKTKGGNHNSWYEAFGNRYDIVAQVDTDFVPKRSFLVKTLGYFRDPKIAFVGTPQVYGNTKDSLIAKGASEQLYTFYGSILRGLSSMNMTLLIGANHVIRVAALRGVNHYSAHITEDLITGMKLHTKGWKSVYTSRPLAIGEGPSTWEAYFNQQMRWAYGCMDILFNHSPKLFNRMELRRAIYYFFLQQHYFTGIAMALSLFLLSLYFFAGWQSANIDLLKFSIVYTFIILVCWLFSVWLQRYNIHRKHEGELLLAGNIISIAAWPVWFLAFLSILTRKRLSYKVTPKGEAGSMTRSSPMVFFPHIVFGLVALSCLISAFFTGRQSLIMLIWALSTTVLMLSVPFVEIFASGLVKLRKGIREVLQKSYRIYLLVEQKLPLELFPEKSLHNISTNNQKVKSSFAHIVADCVFLGFIVVMSVVLYLPHIGFYSDDWAFLGNFALSQDQSLLGLFQTAITPNTMMRPIQNFYDALLYWLFGLNPLGYQLVNAGVMFSTTLLFYFVLRQLKLPRIIALTVPLVYVLLPHYSTDRFWYAAFQVNLSILLYFISLYAALRAINVFTVRKIFWKTVSLVSFIVSALSYEVIIPFFLFNAIILLNPFGKFTTKNFKKNVLQHKPIIFVLLIFIAVFYIFLFKTLTTIRLSSNLDLPYVWEVISSAFWVNYVTLGINLPNIWGQVLSLYSTTTMLIVAGIIYLTIFWYLYYVISQPHVAFPRSSWMRNLTFVSVIIFFLGYFIFFTNNQVGFSPTGVENRVAVAAAIGIAMSIVGIGGLLSRTFFPEKIGRFFFCVIISIVCTGSFLIVTTVATFWIEASKQGQAVLREVYETFPKLPKGITFLLDGVCPYHGPAPVFEAEWDLKGALQTHYHDPTINADIVTPRLKITDKAIQTQIYTFPAYYPYDNLFIYNFDEKSIHSIPDASAAHAYFQKYNPDYNNGCPEYEAGEGVAIFK